MKQWKCNICNYLHTGDEPPDICPVCGADKSEFSLVEEESVQPFDDSTPEEEPSEDAANADIPYNFQSAREKFDKIIIDHHLHPISVHIPNGVIPVAVFLLFTGSLFNNQSLIDAAYYNITIVFLSIPFVLYTGYVEWTMRYKKADTKTFKLKIGSALVVTILSALLSLWKSFSPDAGGSLFFILHLAMLAAAIFAGHIGGKFVFRK